MKIAHTADWHLGKRLENKSRLSEQQSAIDEFAELCDREKVDIVIVAGDVFDTAVPSAEAEELFYKGALNLARFRPVVVLAGNHDDADRLAAPFAIAKSSGIFLIGGLDNTRFSGDNVTGGFGWLKFDLGDERLNLAVLPFPSRSRMEKLMTGQFEDYPCFAAALIDKCTECFDDKNTNVFASHLFMDGCLLSDERQGNAVMLTKEVLPYAHYNALGHIHKPQCVSKSKNAFYSGSLLKYHFDEADNKEFIIYDSKTMQVQHYPISSGKKLIRLHAENFAQAKSTLSDISDCYAELIYESSTPLKPSEAEDLRSNPNLAKLTVINKSVRRDILIRRQQTDAEIFDAYYKEMRGVSPDEQTMKAFLEVLNS